MGWSSCWLKEIDEPRSAYAPEAWRCRRSNTLVLSADLGAQFLPELIGNLQNDLDDGRIELGSGAAQDLFARGIESARLAVGAVAGDGVKVSATAKMRAPTGISRPRRPLG